jgi:hypothetical protein
MSDMDYCKMLEIPVNSCDVIIKPTRRKKKTVVDEVIDKVNAGESANNVSKSIKREKPAKKVKPKPIKTESESTAVSSSKFDIISVQVVAIFVLIVGIILTNIFWDDSGMNNLMRQVFGTNTVKNTATYSTFTATSPSKSQEVALVDGVMSVESGSVYSPCEGTVESVALKDDKYTLTIRHSDSFTTVITGIEMCYLLEGETVYGNVPVGYSSEEMQISMFNDDSVLTGYVLDGNDIVWLI